MIRLDRLGREGLEAQVVLAEILALGVRVWTRESGEAPGDTAMQRMVSAVKLFTGEQENEVRRDKAKAAYKRKRDKGLWVGSRPPYATVVAKDGRLEADSEKAWLIREITAQAIAGKTLGEIYHYARSVAPEAWKTTAGIRFALQHEAYVQVGLRSRSDQDALDELFERNRFRYGSHGRNQHEFTGIFRCGECGRLMAGWQKPRGPALYCSDSPHRGHAFSVYVSKVLPQWEALLDQIQDDGWVEGFESRAEVAPDAQKRRMLERRLASIEREEAALDRRRDNALKALDFAKGGAAEEVASSLSTVNQERNVLRLSKDTIAAELREIPKDAPKGKEIQQLVATIRAAIPNLDPTERNQAWRKFITLIGERPILTRKQLKRGFAKYDPESVSLSWPSVQSYAATESPASRSSPTISTVSQESWR